MTTIYILLVVAAIQADPRAPVQYATMTHPKAFTSQQECDATLPEYARSFVAAPSYVVSTTEVCFPVSVQPEAR